MNLISYLCIRVVINLPKRGRLKALVWFWLIDETLSANLVYQSGHEIGSTIPSDEAMTKIMTMVMVMIKGLNLEKKKEKTKGSRQRYKMKEPFCFNDRDT